LVRDGGRKEFCNCPLPSKRCDRESPDAKVCTIRVGENSFNNYFRFLPAMRAQSKAQGEAERNPGIVVQQQSEPAKRATDIDN
jgi:hypothetical protein